MADKEVDSDGPSSYLDIELKEEEVKTFEDRLDSIERIFRLKELTDQEMKSLTEEEKQLRKKLKDSKKDLSGLRKENWKSSLVSFAIFGVGAVIYYSFWCT